MNWLTNNWRSLGVELWTFASLIAIGLSLWIYYYTRKKYHLLSAALYSCTAIWGFTAAATQVPLFGMINALTPWFAAFFLLLTYGLKLNEIQKTGEQDNRKKHE